jgi:hypothetical protein
MDRSFRAAARAVAVAVYASRPIATPLRKYACAAPLTFPALHGMLVKQVMAIDHRHLPFSLSSKSCHWIAADAELSCD